LQCVAVCCSVWQSIAVYCSVLCCNLLQYPSAPSMAVSYEKSHIFYKKSHKSCQKSPTFYKKSPISSQKSLYSIKRALYPIKRAQYSTKRAMHFLGLALVRFHMGVRWKCTHTHCPPLFSKTRVSFDLVVCGPLAPSV